MMMLDVVKDNTSYFLDVVPVHICYIIISRLLLLVATLLLLLYIKYKNTPNDYSISQPCSYI